MQRWKAVIYNMVFALNCLLIFLVIFEARLVVPAWIQVVGRMHPLVVHFPIVLLSLSVFWELFAGRKTREGHHTSIGDGLLLLTCLTAVLSALMGLLLSKEDGYTPDILIWHKWGGVLIAVLSFAWYVFRVQVREMKIVTAVTAIACLIIVIVTGHQGANITHGEDFIYAPVLADRQPQQVLFDDAEVYANMVQPVFQLKCAGCHNEKKAKGELIMATVALLQQGGKSGPLWDSAENDGGLLLRRIHLPLQSKKHMPPAGKPQLTDEEATIISKWIRSGANFSAKVSELPPTDSLRIIAAAMFSTIETDDYSFVPADDNKINNLHNNYRTVTPLATGSPALGVEFFSAAQFNASQLKELLAVKEQIVALNLNKIPVTDDDLKIIGQFINLRKLNLSFTNIKGAGLQMLKPLKELKQLSLSGTGVSAASLATLATLPNLTRLFIWSTPAQTENLAAIKKQLKNTSIETGFTGDTIKIKLNEPLVQNEEDVLLEPMPLKLKHFIKNVSIRYTTDESEPDSIKSPEYKAGVMIDRSMTVKAKAFKPGWYSSDIVERSFFKAGYKIDSIQLLKAPDQKYKSIDPGVLTDAQKGEPKFGNGKWIGYREQPLEAMMILNEAKDISMVTISSLIDINSYLMPPQEIIIWGGNNAGQLHLIKKITPEQPQKSVPVYIKGYDLVFKTEKLKYIKVMVKPLAKLPAWHGGKGEKGWAFVDEIFLN